MRIREVDIPPRLIEAARSGNLAVFAGAGVSMGEPSDLPSFDELARRIGRGASPSLEHEPFDRYLGRIEDEGVDVQGITRRVLSPSGSTPTALHRGLAGLFASARAVRLVTTNFDSHFSTVITERYGDSARAFFAPALPVGEDFTGLVYLHGSLLREDRLILTESDFGRAYLTQGWATRFLQGLFATYTVLFVGYSHDDSVMRYLARGLPPGSTRYAFTQLGRDNPWMQLGIVPVYYDRGDDGDTHAPLTDAVTGWCQLSRMGALDHEQRIRDLVSVPPSPEPEDVDYLDHALVDDRLVILFTRYARLPEWLPWVAERGHLDNLFGADVRPSRASIALAHWVADAYVTQHSRICIELLALRAVPWSQQLWAAVARAVACAEPPVASRLLGTWVVQLRRAGDAAWDPWVLSELLDRCIDAGQGEPALSLLRQLTELSIGTREWLWPRQDGDDEPRVTIELSLVGDAYHLREAWNSLAQTSMADLYRDLVPLFEDRLIDAHRTLVAAGEAGPGLDPMCASRPSISEHGQNHDRDRTGLLVDAARDLLTWSLSNRPVEARSLALCWLESRVPMLRRLGLYGLSLDTDLAGDEALHIIMRQSVLYARHMKHEVFAVLRTKFGAASASAQDEFIQHSMTVDVLQREVEHDDEQAQQTIAYERYNVAVWLEDVAPESEPAKQHLADLASSHPEFGPREHPDFDTWTQVGVGGPASPLSTAELQEMSEDDLIELVIDYRSDGWEQGTREGLLREVQKAITGRPAMVAQIAAALRGKENWNVELWSIVFGGWSVAEEAIVPWRDVLALLESTPELAPLGKLVIDVIQRGVEAGRYEVEDLDRVECVAEKVLDAVQTVPLAIKPDGSFGGWLFSAINHAAGAVAELWLTCLGRRHEVARDDWRGLPAACKARFERAATAATVADGLVLTVLCSRLHYLSAVDSDWTSGHLLPVLRWADHPEQACYAWHGFLYGGRWSHAVAPSLLDQAAACAERLDSELKGFREALVTRLAGGALFAEVHPLESGWLTAFVRVAGERTLGAWASKVAEGLDSLNRDERASAWDRWIQRFWRGRIDGRPRPFTAAESEAMLRWTLLLGDVRPAAFELVLQTPVHLGANAHFWWTLRDDTLLNSRPNEMAAVVLHALSRPGDLTWLYDRVDAVVRKLIAARADLSGVQAICSRLGELSCPTARSLLDLARREFGVDEDGTR